MRILGGCLMLVLGVGVLALLVYGGFWALFFSAVVVGSMGGTLLIKAAFVVLCLLVLALVLAIAVLCFVAGFRLIFKREPPPA